MTYIHQIDRVQTAMAVVLANVDFSHALIYVDRLHRPLYVRVDPFPLVNEPLVEQ
jgi:hypothetical protein